MIKINSVTKNDLIHYLTARIDIKNSGKFNNQIEFLSTSDEESDLSFPDWFKHNDGHGMVIESSKGNLDLKIKCIKDGNLIIRLRGIHARLNNTIIPIFINYTSLIVNGKDLLDKNVLVSHDNYYDCYFKVYDKDIVFIHIEWLPFKIKQ